MKIIKIISRILFLLVFALILLFVSGKLFFEQKFDVFLSDLKDKYFVSVVQEEHALTIGLSSEFISFDPLQNEVSVRERLAQIYEGLVLTDPFLEIEPGLAISFGALDDLTWEFRLRKNVYFHDNTLLTVDDVIFSLEEAWKNPRSGLSSDLASLKKIEKIDTERFLIRTSTPDPLLMQKLALVYIFPEHAAETILKKPIGTGPYQYLSNTGLKRFENYWGKKPQASKVTLLSFPSREQRKSLAVTGEVDILANFPPEDFQDFPKSAPLALITAQTLESNFLLFNFKGIFADKNLRSAVSLALSREEIVKLAFGFASPATQFVGKGIFGYDSRIGLPEVRLDEAKRLVKNSGYSGRKISLDLPAGFQAISDFLVERLQRIGLKAEARFHDPAALEKIILDGKSDLFFFGWRSTLGDASGFFNAVLHSKSGEYGTFNGISYKNPEVDKLIEESERTLKPLDRLAKLRQVMNLVVEKDIVGIPLFTPEALYAKKKGISWNPRIDGYILASEVGF